MGASQSHVIEIPGGGSEGYHVLRVQPNSPGEKAGLEPFFDFIVMIGNTRLDRDNENLKEILKTNVEKPVKLMVFSSKTITCREVSLTPSTLWGGQGLLGVSIRFCTFENAHENVWHILETENSSPAHFAGLRAFTDYIIGADSISLAEQDDLFSLIEAHDGRPVKLFVYNSETDSCRDVVVTPNSAWGGDGLLGCGIGYGLLHRIPTDAREHSVSHEPRQEVPVQAQAAPTQVALPAQTQPVSASAVQLPQTQPTSQITQQTFSQNPALNNLPDLSNLGISPGLQNLANIDFSKPIVPTSSVTASSLNNLPNISNLNLGNMAGLPPLNLPNLNAQAPVQPNTTALPQTTTLPASSLATTSTLPGLGDLNLPSLPPGLQTTLNSTVATGSTFTTRLADDFEQYRRNWVNNWYQQPKSSRPTRHQRAKPAPFKLTQLKYDHHQRSDY